MKTFGIIAVSVFAGVAIGVTASEIIYRVYLKKKTDEIFKKTEEEYNRQLKAAIEESKKEARKYFDEQYRKTLDMAERRDVEAQKRLEDAKEKDALSQEAWDEWRNRIEDIEHREDRIREWEEEHESYISDEEKEAFDKADKVIADLKESVEDEEEYDEDQDDDSVIKEYHYPNEEDDYAPHNGLYEEVTSDENFVERVWPEYSYINAALLADGVWYDFHTHHLYDVDDEDSYLIGKESYLEGGEVAEGEQVCVVDHENCVCMCLEWSNKTYEDIVNDDIR